MPLSALAPLLPLLLLVTCQSLEQFTPEKADWSTYYDKAGPTNSKNTDHSPDGIHWIPRESWQEWDKTIFNPAKHSKTEFANLICQGDTVRGIRTLFYQHNPFADIKNPTKAEVDNWHALALNHVRAMVGYTGDDYTIKPDKCLHLRALWSDERHRSKMWDTDAYPGTCEGSTNPHCGASFIPSVADQQEYLPADIDSCGAKAGSEGIFSAAKANIPWSIKWARPFCNTLRAEGFWGGHTGPWFHRTEFGWSWWDADRSNQNSNALLRTKWSGKSGKVLYTNPDISSGKFLVQAEDVDPNPRFLGYECSGIRWDILSGTDSATKCYEQLLAEDNCGKRFMTYNTGNSGCACYPPNMAVCEPKMVSQRSTWDFLPRASSFDGFFIDTDKKLTRNALPYSGRVCPNIIWKTGAGDAAHCLQKIVESKYADCGTKYITFNANGGGCACYPPAQKTCSQTTAQSGRQTFELEVDPSYDPTTNRNDDPDNPDDPAGAAAASGNNPVAPRTGALVFVLMVTSAFLLC